MASCSGPRLVLLLALGAAGSTLQDDLQHLQTDMDIQKEWKEKPIARVVNMLKDMQAQLQKEADEDEALYDKLVCWCETNDKEKSKAIADATQLNKELTATIKENSALASTREAEIGQLTKEETELTNALNEAEALRAKENAEFNQSEKDLINSISSLTGAVTSLGHSNGVGGQGLLQREALLQVSQKLRHHVKEAVAAVAPHMRAQVRALLLQPASAISLLQAPDVSGALALLHLKDPAGSLLQESQPPGQGESYASQSGGIFGMLQQMKETFETNFETGKKNEAQAVADYESISSTKTEQLKAVKNKIFTKGQEFSQAEEVVANSDENMEDTTKQLDADTAFLAKLKQMCGDIDAQWEERSKVRSEEITAVAETLNVLTSDESRDQFNDAGAGVEFTQLRAVVNDAEQFMQLRAVSRLQVRARESTADFLAAWGKQHNSPRISMLSAKVRNDVFAKVKESIDGMVVVLDGEQHSEVDKKDGCVSDFNTNDKQTTERTAHKEDTEAEINQLKADTDHLNEEESALTASIAQAQVELKAAGENRQQENKDFQQCVSDQQATQTILEKAKQRMADFYAKKRSAFLQRNALKNKQTPPGSFKPLKKNKGGNKVMMLLNDIIAESKATEADALFAEQTSQKNYEATVAETNASIKAMQAKITNDEAIEAEEVEKMVFDQGDRRATNGDLLKLGEVGQTLHKACDYTVDNFDVRQTKRADEMEALKQSKSIFSGASFER